MDIGCAERYKLVGDMSGEIGVVILSVKTLELI